MEAFKRFSKFEKDYIENEYQQLTDKRRLGLWWNLLVHKLIFHSGSNSLNHFTSENYQKWRIIEKNIDIFLEELMPEIWEHGPWEEGTTLDEVRITINNLLGKSKSEETDKKT